MNTGKINVRLVLADYFPYGDSKIYKTVYVDRHVNTWLVEHGIYGMCMSVDPRKRFIS
jgi:hypothetical protein